MNAVQVMNGEWVGESGTTAWRLHVDGRRGILAQCNDDQTQPAARFECTLSETPVTFTFGEPYEEFTGIALDMQCVVIVGLDAGNDVIFSRPGLAELFVRDAYRSADLTNAPGRFALSCWATA